MRLTGSPWRAYPKRMRKGRGAGALLNISQLAEELGFDRRTVYNWLRDGSCPITPAPGLKPAKFRVVDVEAYTGRPYGSQRPENLL